jgi:hypothetical protein
LRLDTHQGRTTTDGLDGRAEEPENQAADEFWLGDVQVRDRCVERGEHRVVELGQACAADRRWPRVPQGVQRAVGRLGGLHGRRRLFLVGMIVFVLAGGTIFMGSTTSDGASFLMAAGCTIALGADALGLYPTTSAEANVGAARAQAL